jgi:hypothetical protein
MDDMKTWNKTEVKINKNTYFDYEITQIYIYIYIYIYIKVNWIGQNK